MWFWSQIAMSSAIFALLMFWLVRGVWGLWNVPNLSRFAPLESEDCPRVSIVVAARNEERHIRGALQTLLQLDYPDWELVVVNDRSTDGTGEILREVAAEHPELQVVEIEELPSGWLGKNHALQRGAEIAKGEWLLFTDADIFFEPPALRQAMRCVQERQLDHLAGFPDIDMPNWFLEGFVITFTILLFAHYRPDQASDPESDAFVGIGAFNLVRRDRYFEIGGHEPLRMRPDDDMMLGKALKKGGCRQGIVFGFDAMSVPWYGSLGEVIVGLEKNAFAGTDYSPVKVLFASLTLTIVYAWPLAAVAFSPWPAWLIYLAAIGVVWLQFIASALRGNGVWWAAPLAPLYVLLFLYITLRSMFLAYYQNGIRWRDTLYPLDELRANEV